MRLGDRPVPNEPVASTQQFFVLYVGAPRLALFVLIGAGMEKKSAYTAAAATLGPGAVLARVRAPVS